MNNSLNPSFINFRACKNGVQKYQNNKIQTSKYTWYTFFPKNILEQFSKLANVYFLQIYKQHEVLAVLQSITIISISDGQPTILLPLSIILVVTMIKDLYEDMKRRKSDNQENSADCFVNNQQLKWKDIKVGDLIKINDGQQIPCDILILQTYEKNGQCFVETKSLDGETNLKPKLAFSKTQNSSYEQLQQIIVEYEMPNNQLYKFYGSCYQGFQNNTIEEFMNVINEIEQVCLKIKKISDQEKLSSLKQEHSNLIEKLNSYQFIKSSIDYTNLLLRGSILKNSGSILGITLYTGHETKIMLNSIKAKYKQSKLEKSLSKRIIYIFLLQIVVCFFCSIFYSVWYEGNKNELCYLEINQNKSEDNSFAYNFFVRLGNWILMFGYILFQISNLVPISLLVTLETVRFCQAFLIQYDDKLTYNQEKCSVQSSNLNEELGQIECILSDKTGTLTQNKMVFKQICIDGISYGDNTNNVECINNVQFYDENFNKNLIYQDNNFNHAILNLAICHSAFIQKVEDKITYNVTSPDELALLNFVYNHNIIFNGIDQQQQIMIDFKGQQKLFKELYRFEFNSTRKRSSIIVHDLERNKIIMYTKGADSIILKRQVKENQEKIKNLYNQYIESYSVKGLRTLLLAYREFHWSEFSIWEAQYKKTMTILENREQLLEDLQDQLENELVVVGLTGIEDKLQDNVEQTIYYLQEAGINFWVLTGDKIETAINIAKSCKLINQASIIQICQEPDYESIKFNLVQGDALVISGDCLSIILENQFLIQSLTKISEFCKTILCCRVSPLQKQQVVSFVRKNFPEKSTLAIGDGANDVSMISSANVGVGIKGLEGQQAARAADYAIGEFQQLRQLLFVHGRESYRKNSELVLYNFYKNILLVFPQFWFSIFNNFSGQRIYDNLIYQAYNIFYTSMPIIIYAIFDKEFQESNLFSNKFSKYKLGIKNKIFNTKQFTFMIINSLYQSILISYISIYTFEKPTHQNGKTFSLWYTGTVIFWLAILISNLKIITISNSWSVAHIFFFLGMLLMFIFTLIIFQTFPSFDGVFYIFQSVFKSTLFYLTCILIAGITSFVEYGILTYTLMNKNYKANRIYQMELSNQYQTISQGIQN